MFSRDPAPARPAQIAKGLAAGGHFFDGGDGDPARAALFSPAGARAGPETPESPPESPFASPPPYTPPCAPASPLAFDGDSAARFSDEGLSADRARSASDVDDDGDGGGFSERDCGSESSDIDDVRASAPFFFSHPTGPLS